MFKKILSYFVEFVVILKNMNNIHISRGNRYMFFVIGFILLGFFLVFTFSALKLAKRADEEMERDSHYIK